MALKAWHEFYPDVLTSVRGCPQPTVDHHLRRAAIELCTRSRRLKLDMPAFNTVAGTAEYALAPGAGMETVQIIDAAVDGVPIDPVRRAIASTMTDWSTDQGRPSLYLMSGNDETVRLWKTPDAVYAVTLTLAIKPDQAAVGIEDWFGDRYNDTIAAGALARLMALPKKVWTNPDLALYHNERFEAGVSRACAEAIKDGTSAPLHTKKYGRA